MQRHPKTLLAISLFIAMAGLTGCDDNDTEDSTVAAPKQPNVLFIMADDLGYSDIGAFGGEIKTPNLDALASEGRLLSDYHTAPTCSPTRSELLSGTDHHLAGIGAMAELTPPHLQGKPGYEGYLNAKALSLPEILKDNGYHTYMAGKWHLGLTEELSPKARGFEKSFALLQGLDLHFKTQPAGVTRPGTYREDGKLVTLPDGYFSTNYYTDKLISYIDQNKTDGKPFFGYAAYTAPHWPIQAPDDFIDRYKGKYDAGYEVIRDARIARQKQLGIIPQDFKPATPLLTVNVPKQRGTWAELTAEQQKFEARKMEVYAGMVENLDYNIGRLITYLKQNKLYDNTLIFFVSDNGAEGFERGSPTGYDNSYDNIGRATSYHYIGPRWAEVSATPFHLWKDTAGEGATTAPAIVRLPNQSRSESIYRGFASVTDVLPTILDISSIKNPGANYQGRTVHPITGLSWIPVLKNQKASVREDNYVFADELHGNKYARNKQWKIAFQNVPSLGTGKWELYNLTSDRGEREDVSAQHPDVLNNLIGVYNKYTQDNGVLPYNASEAGSQ